MGIPFNLNIDQLGAIASMVRNNDLEEIVLENGEEKLTVRGKAAASSAAVCVPAQNSTAASTQTVQNISVSVPVKEEKTDDAILSGKVVKSPIVGTYYASPAPGKPAFVSEGKTVAKGDTIMIIESMKLMNEIQSEFDGTVTKILVHDGDAVEFDQPIMIIG